VRADDADEDHGTYAAARILTAAATSTFFLLLFSFTLLPGLELGDSPSFQTMVGSPVISPRDGYPLYYAISGVGLWLFGGDPAHVLNFTSAAVGAIACGLVALVAAELAGSSAGGAVAALLFGGSYTFWSQSVIAEVYALHIALVALTLLLLFRWNQRPTLGRLAAFFAVYAVSFGNHLSMILLMPAYAGFLLVRAPQGWRSMLRPSILGLALLLALAGAAQYLWNLSAVWLWPSAPSTLREALEVFWFDVTKSDWRDTMVLRVPPAMAGERLRMYAFDLRQQFGGLFVIVLAVVGAWRTARRSRDRFLLLCIIFLTNLVFALGYNVGDSHVFFLPSHLIVAVFAGAGAASLAAALKYPRPTFAVAVVLAAFQIYRNYPALDRSTDHRPRQLLDAVTAGVDDRTAILLTDMNWQVQNGLTYYANRIRPEVAFARLADVLLYAPALVKDNVEIGRRVIVTERAKAQLEAAYGPLFQFHPDVRYAPEPLAAVVRRLPAGTRYALTLLSPSREFLVDRGDLSDAMNILTGGRSGSLDDSEYVAVVGQIGEAPDLAQRGSRPFRVRAVVGGIGVEVRMESWLAFDTIRRMGFGHVIANRHHTLIVERGISFAAFDRQGAPLSTAYFSGIYARPARFFVTLR